MSYRHDPGCPCCECPCLTPTTGWSIDYRSNCPCMNGIISLVQVANEGDCCVWVASLACGVTYTTWTLRVCNSGITLQVRNAAGVLLIQFSAPFAGFACNGPNTLSVDVNNLICDPDPVVIYPACPQATSMLKCFDMATGEELWNQSYRNGNVGAFSNEQLLTNWDGSKVFSGCMDFDASNGNGLYVFPSAELHAPCYIDSSGRRYRSNRRRYLPDGTLDASWPSEDVNYVPTHFGMIGLDDTWACYVMNGAVYFISVSTGIYHRHAPPEAGGYPYPWQEEDFIGFVSNFACYNNGKLYQQTGETYTVLGGSDNTGIKLSDRIYDSVADMWCCPGLHPQYSLQHAINSDGSFIIPSGHNPPGDTTTYRFLKCQPGSPTPVAEFTVTDLDDTSVGPFPSGNLVSWYPSPSGDAIFLYQSGLGPERGGRDNLRYYQWGSPTCTWKRSFICPDDQHVGLTLHDGTHCYASTFATDGAGHILGIPDPCSVKPHNWPAWSTGCLPSPPPSSPSGGRASAGLCTPQAQVEISGVVGNGECAKCLDVNGTYILTLQGNGTYAYVGDNAPCPTCSTTPATKFAIVYDGTIKIRLGAHLTSGPTPSCSSLVYDAIWYSKLTEVVQLDLFQPYEFEFQSGVFAPPTRQCNWSGATVILTGIDPSVVP